MNEQEPQLPSHDLMYIDVLKELKHGDFFDAILQVEASVEQANDAATKDGHVEVLEELFGLEYKDGICNILASSYRRQEDGYLTVQSSFFHAAGVVYKGIVIEAIDGEDRVLIKYCEDETGTEHFVLPESLLQLAISETSVREEIRDVLLRYVDDTKEMVSSRSFLSMSYEDQQEKLQEKFLNIESDLNDYADDDPVELDCEEYYSIPDVRMTIALDDAYMDQSDSPRIKVFRPSGRIMSSSLLEQLEGRDFEHFVDGPLPYRRFDEFARSGGVPCVILRDESVKVTYVVQLDKVRDVIRIETADSDDDGEAS